MPPVKKRTPILVATAVVVGLLGILAVFFAHSGRMGPVHVFELAETPAFLTEPMALTKAYATLKLDGVDASRYEPYPYNRTKSPDGAIDQYLTRNALNSNRGVIMFTNGPDSPVRFVHVELDYNKVRCQSSIGK